ncbi:MAG: putative lipid II flippase FtsW [Clostridium sp.]
MKEKRKSIDFVLFLVVLMLLGIGLVMIFSASMVSDLQEKGTGYHHLIRQAVWSIIGIIAMLFIANIDYRKLQNKRLISIGIITISVLLVVVLFTPPINGARRWIGINSFALQPSELAKIVLIVYFADVLTRKGQRVKSFAYGVFPTLFVAGIFSGLILIQPNMSTAVILFATVFCMLIVAGAKPGQLMGLALSGIGVAATFAMSADYRRKRVFAFLNPWQDPLESGYQAIQSLYGLGAGGFFGLGLGQSRQKWLYIPEAQNDFIFAIIGEELGFIGVFFVISLFAILIWRGFKIALNCKDKFGTLLATGVTSFIAIQTSINLLVVSSFMPVTGVTLPLISYGGSSLVFTLASLGILLSISRYGERNGVE